MKDNIYKDHYSYLEYVILIAIFTVIVGVLLHELRDLFICITTGYIPFEPH